MGKKSHADCSICPLYNQKRVIGETNCKDDLSKVSVLILAEAPSHEEIAQNKPLVGPSGKIFRKAFEESGLYSLPYYISNVVLCANISENGKTQNPPQEAIDLCKVNMDHLIKKTRPELIIAMGSTPMRVMNIAQNGILKLNGTIHEYNGHKVFLVCHPSYILRNGGIDSQSGKDFRNLFNKAYHILEDNKCSNFNLNIKELTVKSTITKNPKTNEAEIVESDEDEDEIVENLEKPYTFKLPTWCYGNNVCLIDIQNIRGTGSILYTFKDKDGKKIFYKEPSTKKYYYMGKDTHTSDAPMLENIKNVSLIKSRMSKKDIIKSTYEQDLRAVLKRSIDYYIERDDVPECDVELSKMYFDIEVYSAGVKEFPDPRVAPSPVNAISFQVDDGPTNVWMYKDSRMDKSEVTACNTEHQTIIKIFDTERELLTAFFKEVAKSQPDIITGWNCVREDQRVWLTDRIVEIKDVKEKNKLCAFGGDIKKVKNTGPHDTYKITLSNGLELYSSIDHRFPYYIMNITKLSNTQSFDINTAEFKTVGEIKKLLNTNKVYLYVHCKSNRNKNLTIETCIRDYNSTSHNRYIEIFIENLVSVGINKIANCTIGIRTKSFDELYSNIYPNKPIPRNVVRVLGKAFSLYKNNDLEEEMSNAINMAKCELDDTGFVQFCILYKSLYTITENEEKSLNIELLSRFSNVQFIAFLVGVLFPGSLKKSEIKSINEIVEFSNKKHCNQFLDLLLWNGIYASVVNNKVNIKMTNDINTYIEYLNENNEFAYNITDIYSHGSNSDKNIATEIISIEPLNETSQMYDIETSNHYFLLNGVYTHNCDKFDIPTLFNRAKLHNIDVNQMSPIGTTYSNPNIFGESEIFGLFVCDMLELYKKLAESVEESYKLDYISQKILGKGKVAYEGTLDILYESDINKFIEYSSVDTFRLRELDVELEHINLRFEMIKMCSSTWRCGRTTMGLIDPLCVSYAKKMNLVCRTSLKSLNEDDASDIKDEEKESIPGGYVRIPTPGLKKYIIDLDFTSLYPSIICTYNIGPNTYIGKIDSGLAKAIIYYKDRLDRDLMITYIENPIKKNHVTKKMKCGELLDLIDKNNYIVTVFGCIYKNHQEEMSFFERIVQYILTSRKAYKAQMNNAIRSGDIIKSKQMKNKQLAYKILANSLYGVLANENFRMFNEDMATTITLSGQEAIKFVGMHLNNYLEKDRVDIDPSFLNNYEDIPLKYLIYTDTDSVFISLGEYLTEKGEIKL